MTLTPQQQCERRVKQAIANGVTYKPRGATNKAIVANVQGDQKELQIVAEKTIQCVSI